VGLLIDKKQKHKCQVLTEEKLDEIGARLEHRPRKSLKCLAQETGVSKSSARRSTQFLKLKRYKTTVIHTLQPRNPAVAVGFYSVLSKLILTRK
jgi:response regulator of citrate/malate metabolism